MPENGKYDSSIKMILMEHHGEKRNILTHACTHVLCKITWGGGAFRALIAKPGQNDQHVFLPPLFHLAMKLEDNKMMRKMSDYETDE